MRGGYGQGGAPRGRGGGYAGGAKANNNSSSSRAADARAVMGVADALYTSPQGGGSGGSVPSDALLVRVSSIVQPVTEDLMRRVFDSAGVTVRHVKVDMTAGGSEALVHARFADMYAAERALNALNGRNIFNNANKMTITYARGSRSGGNGGGNAGDVAATSAVLATPPHMAAAAAAAMLPMGGAALPGDMAYGNNAAAANMQLGMMYNAPMAALPSYDGGNIGSDGSGGVAFAQGQAMMPYAMPQAGGVPYMNAAAGGAPVMPPVPGAPGMALYHAQQQPQQLPPQPLPTLPLPQVQMNGGNNGNTGGVTLTVGGRAVGRVRGVGVGGGRGRGGGGGAAAAAASGGYGMTTMSYAPQAAPFMGMSPAGMMSMMQSPGQAGAIMGLPVGVSHQLGGGGGSNNNNISNAPTVYISVTTVPADEPLQTVFVLLEAYGGVVSIRRNHNKKEIMTVKMASIEDADQVIRYVQRVPLGETATLSSKRFANYTERHPCTDDGDPLSLETTQFDFTASRHRSPAQRSKSSPTSMLRVTGCAAYSEAELMTYLNTKGFYPERITKDDDGAFTLQIADTRTAVKLLIQCHGNVCNQERTNVIFIDGPKTAPSASGATATTSVGAEGATSKSDTTTHAATANGGDVDDEEQMQPQHSGGDMGAVLQH